MQECDRKAGYRVLDKREAAGKSNPLNFGGAVHAGLDIRYKAGGPAFDSLGAQQVRAIEYLNKNPTDDWRNSELLVEVLAGYARTYPFEDFQVVAGRDESGNPSPFVELPFAVPMGTITLDRPLQLQNLKIPLDPTTNADAYRLAALTTEGPMALEEFVEIPVIWTGKIDLVVIHNGEYWLIDHKTSSQFGDTYFEQFKISSQFLGYKWALEQMLKIPIAGTMVNVLAIRKPTKTGKNCTYHRKWMNTESHMVPEWLSNTMFQLTEFFANVQNGYLPMRTTACRTKWHSNCEYLGVCTLPPEQRQMYLHTGDFQTVTWSPLREE